MPQTATEIDSEVKRLIADFQEGKEDAFDALAKLIAPRICTSLRLRVRTDLVEDIFQEFLLRLYTARRRYDLDRCVGGYLFTMARNAATDYLRKHRRESGIVQLDMNDWRHHGATEPTGEQELIRKEAFLVLDEEERRTVDLCWNWGYKQERVAEIMRLPISTVKYRLLTAREKLERHVGGVSKSGGTERKKASANSSHAGPARQTSRMQPTEQRKGIAL